MKAKEKRLLFLLALSIAFSCTACGGTEEIESSSSQDIESSSSKKTVCEHLLWSTPEEKAPTCTESGWFGGAVCEDCGEIFEPQEEIPAQGHVWLEGVCEVCGMDAPIGEEGGGLVFAENEDGGYTVTGIGYYSNPHVVVPAAYKGKPVTRIGYGAFYDCKSMESVELPQTLTYLGGYAFGACSNLTEITVPEGVASIGDYAFQDCRKLERVTLQEGVESIGDSAFRMSGVKEIVIPSTLVYVEEDAFDNCLVESVYIADLSAWCEITFENQYAQPMSASSLYLNGVQVTEIVLPKELTTVLDYAFCGGQFDSVVLHENVRSIGRNAFYSCGLKSLALPESVSAIGEYAFAHNDFETLVIPSRVTELAKDAFRGCERLTSVTLPRGITRLGTFAFWNCVSLSEIVYLGTEAEWALVAKEYEWDHNVENYTVRCADSK